MPHPSTLSIIKFFNKKLLIISRILYPITFIIKGSINIALYYLFYVLNIYFKLLERVLIYFLKNYPILLLLMLLYL